MAMKRRLTIPYRGLLAFALAFPVFSAFSADSIVVRVAAYNVAAGEWGSPERVGEIFRQFDPDVIGFNEVPGGDWTARVGSELGMEYAYVGAVSSAGHANKYKSILSRTPLTGTEEFTLTAGRGWNPASAVRAETTINGVTVALYSLHLARSGRRDGHAYQFADEVIANEESDRVIVMGDFNNEIGGGAMDTIEAFGLKPVWRDIDMDLRRNTTIVEREPVNRIIDHILYNVSSGARASGAGIVELNRPPSDHKPVWAEIVFPLETGMTVMESGK